MYVPFLTNWKLDNESTIYQFPNQRPNQKVDKNYHTLNGVAWRVTVVEGRIWPALGAVPVEEEAGVLAPPPPVLGAAAEALAVQAG